jgi:CDP-glucose 4,6-dehydratase
VDERQGTLENLVMFNGFYANKTVLVTGHTGFKGSWASLWLANLGARVWGFSQPAPTNPNLHEIISTGAFEGQQEGDIRDYQGLLSVLEKANPDLVLHMAAQPIVRRSYAEPIHTLQTNVMGTAHVLEAIRTLALGCPVVVVTSDKCYENREWEFAYRETDALGGHDVYSMSKAATELVAQSWRRSFFIPDPKLGSVATVRAGNVIGGGDYAIDRIVPDCVRALSNGEPILVRNPDAVRPWQHVLECLSGYLWLGARLGLEGKGSTLGTAFNFGPGPTSRQPVRRLVDEVLAVWPGKWTDGSSPDSVHESTLLSLATDKAAALLDWYPVWDFRQTVHETIAWYYQRHVVKLRDMLTFTQRQIELYAEAARGKGIAWTR